MAKSPIGLTPTSIEWADHAFNPLRAVLTREVWVRNGLVVDAGLDGARRLSAGRTGWACVKKSEGCTNCYSEALNKRWGTGLRFRTQYLEDGLVRFELDRQRIEAAGAHSAGPRWRSKAGDGRPKVFVADMTDLFAEHIPFETLNDLWSLFEDRSDVDWLLLTKRPERMALYLGNRAPLPNVWAGTSVENQEWAERRLPHLRNTPAPVRFLSCEPLVGPLPRLSLEGIGWVIVGGESGAGARECDLAWMRSINVQCRQAGVACFNKQVGSRPVENGGRVLLVEDGKTLRGKGGQFEHWPHDLQRREWPVVATGVG